jgi:hypothetical protein
VVCRSEDAGESAEQVAPELEPEYLLKLGRQRHRDDVEFNELDIRLKISYKTLLLVFVLFDVSHRIITSASDSNFWGLLP